MKSKQQSPVWPYLGILGCLFVLSLTAPRAWERMTRHESLSQMLASRKPTATREACESAQYEAVSNQVEAPAKTALRPSSDALDIQVTEVGPPAPEPEPQVVSPAPGFAQEVQQPTEALQPADESPIAELKIKEPAVASPAEEPATESDATAAGGSRPLPRVLLEQFAGVLEKDPSAAWAQQSITLVRELCGHENRPPADILADLRTLSEQQKPAGGGTALKAQIARTQYALTRWLEIWEATAAWDQVPLATDAPAIAPERILNCLKGADTVMRTKQQGAAWREYLLLDKLRELASTPADQKVDERRAVARKVLDRMASSQLTQSQRKFLSAGPLAVLQRELPAWAAEPVTSARLLAHLEQYEYSGLPSDARLVADDWRGLHWSSPAEAEQLSEHLEAHYGNANVRVAVSSSLLNRMVPQPKPVGSSIRDTVMNVPTYGRSTTDAKIVVRTVPDPKRIRVGLEAHGLVSSDTVSTSGPAKFHNSGQSSFLVRKLIVVGPQGMTIWPAVAEAENNYSYLVSLETDFDGVPLFGSLVRNIARSQHDEKQGQALKEVEQKVATRALDQFDAEVRPHLVKAAQNLQDKQAALLNRLGLEFVPVGMSTTEDRAVARIRVASTTQLGAHTPRPQAPSDSWFSMQVNQSAINNGLEGLELNGREFKLPELFAWLAKKLDRPELAENEDLPEGVRVTFAKQDAVRLRCVDNRVEVTLSFAKLTQGSKTWRNFTVKTYYLPEAKDRDPRFVRDKSISLGGKSVRGPEPMLRTIFSKVLSRNRDISLLSEEFTRDPRMEGLDISQFVVDDGWIGLAYSPRRAPGNVARRPK